MGITEILGLLGGLALFLYGMQMMSGGLEDAAGNKMKTILEKLTSNRILGVLVGAGITAVIQSSSATTVMVVGFVNTGLMALRQAVWVIMGANIGTTITGQLIALDVGLLAPLFAFLGVAVLVFLKNVKLHPIGKIFAGLGILFIGMNIMSDSMYPLRESQEFVSLMTKFSNPFLAILIGAGFTAIIQSSSASIGILQALASTGLVSFQGAAFILFGMNIGTCITAVLASIGTNRSAKRTTVIHLLFNVIGTLVFTTICLILPITDLVAMLSPDSITKQIANMHTLFNISTSLLLLPFGTYLATLAEKILPDLPRTHSGVSSLPSLSEEFRLKGFQLGANASHIDSLKKEIIRITSLAGENTKSAFDVIINSNNKSMESIANTEETIDALNKEISQYISKILVHSSDKQSVADIEQYFLITGNAERIGDHASNIAGYFDVINEKNITFSENAKQELIGMRDIIENALNKAVNKSKNTTAWMQDIVQTEEKIDDLTRLYREKHLERMRNGECSEEACILYSELLTDFERIGDHILNIAQAYSKISA